MVTLSGNVEMRVYFVYAMCLLMLNREARFLVLQGDPVRVGFSRCMHSTRLCV